MDGGISAAESVTLWFCHVKPHNPIHSLLQHNLKIVGLLIREILSPSPTFWCLDWLSHDRNRLLIFLLLFELNESIFLQKETLQLLQMFYVRVLFDSEAGAQRFSVRKDVLRNFAKFTWKHLRHSLFFNRVAGLRSGRAVSPPPPTHPRSRNNSENQTTTVRQ